MPTIDTSFYQPTQTVIGPAYSPWFKLLATVTTIVLMGYGVSVALRFPIMDYGLGVQLHSTVTIDAQGITQTWLINRHVDWRDVRSAKMIGIPRAGWLFPPRLVVRTGTSYNTFNGGTATLLTEFAKISLAFQMKK